MAFNSGNKEAIPPTQQIIIIDIEESISTPFK